ncbi:MAG: DNA glycosylase [Chloroflexota bacterium]|nr:DNA glycosylase [Chloroflexota bacterium]
MIRHIPLDPHTNHPFNLQNCLEGRQDFRWRKLPNGSYSGVLHGNLVHIHQSGDRLLYQSTPDSDLSDLLTSYFRLTDDLDAIYTKITKIADRDDHIAALIEKYPGVRIMRQPDPWECLVSYICSARATPPKIARRVETIATQLGRPLSLNGETRHTFPDPQTVLDAGPDRLTQMALGFDRVPHAITQAAQRILDGRLDLHRLAQPDIPYTETVSHLTDLYCVGPKIANCVALFALDKTEAFPVDSRVRNTVKKLYPSHTHSTDDDIITWAQDLFGPHAGYTNQLLYMG